MAVLSVLFIYSARTHFVLTLLHIMEDGTLKNILNQFFSELWVWSKDFKLFILKINKKCFFVTNCFSMSFLTIYPCILTHPVFMSSIICLIMETSSDCWCSCFGPQSHCEKKLILSIVLTSCRIWVSLLAGSLSSF